MGAPSFWRVSLFGGIYYTWRDDGMPDRVIGEVSMSGVTIFRSRENEAVRKIEMLEADNFELRNEITRLTLHNATLRSLTHSAMPRGTPKRKH
jgi:hypothetical protein